MVKGNATVRIERKVSKRRYPDGKHTYTYERFYVPIPSRLHDIVRPFLNQRLKKHNPSKRRTRNHCARLFFWGTKIKKHTSGWSLGPGKVVVFTVAADRSLTAACLATIDNSHLQVLNLHI